MDRKKTMSLEVKLSNGKKIGWRRLIGSQSPAVMDEEYQEDKGQKMNQRNCLLLKENFLSQELVLQKN